MLSTSDLATVYDFVKDTGEGNLRKMMTSPKMTTHHIGLLLKVVRNCKPDEFIRHAEAATYPKMKFNDNEDKLKETFWPTAFETFVQLGLATAQKAA